MAAITWDRVREAGSRLTTPLHPDDYLRLVNPLWTARELRGRVEKVVPETEDAATLVIRPGWGWRWDHRPGQYLGIGIQVEGRYQWRSYSISSPPRRSGRHVAITVRAMPEGLLSSHLVKGLEPGTIVRLAAPEGDFVLPDPPPERLLFLVGGSGITPVMAMLRTLDRRRTMPDVVLHYSSPTPERMIFRDELADLEQRHDGAHRAPVAHRRRRHARPGRPRRPLPRLARARDLRLRPRPDAGRRHRTLRGARPRGAAAPRAVLARARRRRGRGRHDHLPQLREVGRGRRCDHGARGGRGGRRRDAVRLPDGDLPHLHAHARLRPGPRPAQRRRVRPAQRAGPDLHHRGSRRLHARHLHRRSRRALRARLETPWTKETATWRSAT